MTKPQVLLVEDDSDWIDIYRQNLVSADYKLVETASVNQAFAKMRENTFAVILTDLKLLGAGSEYGGFEILQEAKLISPSTQVIVMTAFGSREFAVRAMQHGALDYVVKPIDYEKLHFTIGNAIRIHEELNRGKKQQKNTDTNRENVELADRKQISIIGNSRSMQQVHKRVAEAASTETPCLIIGDRGTGKSLIARSIHLNSNRSERNFMQISCLDLRSLQRRAFIHQLKSRNGTLFVKNLNQLDLTTIDIMFEIFRLCTTLNIRLMASSQIGRDELGELLDSFDRKLEFANAFNEYTTIIWVPPLQKRKDSDDTISLAGHFLRNYNETTNTDVKLDETAIDTLNDLEFERNNVQEMFDILQTAADLASKGQNVIDRRVILEQLKNQSNISKSFNIKQVFVSYSSMDRDFVRKFIKELRSTEMGSEFLDFWIDQERIPFGSVFWDSEVEKGLETSTVMLLIVSKQAMESKEVGREWRYFLGKGFPILTVMYEEAPMPYRLKPIQSLAYSEINRREIISQVVQSLMKV